MYSGAENKQTNKTQDRLITCRNILYTISKYKIFPANVRKVLLGASEGSWRGSPSNPADNTSTLSVSHKQLFIV